MIDKLKAPPAAFAGTVIDAIGATPVEALAGPVHFGILAHIAAPLLGRSGSVPALAGEMAKAADEATWRSALLAKIKVTDD